MEGRSNRCHHWGIVHGQVRMEHVEVVHEGRLSSSQRVDSLGNPGVHTHDFVNLLADDIESFPLYVNRTNCFPCPVRER